MSKVIRCALGVMVLFASLQTKSVEFLRYDLVIFMCGCKSLSKKADAVQVGPFMIEIIGLILRGSYVA